MLQFYLIQFEHELKHLYLQEEVELCALELGLVFAIQAWQLPGNNIFINQ